MDDTTHTIRSPLQKLGQIKYVEWERAMFGRLMSVGGARIATGEETPPSPNPSDPAAVLARHAFLLRSDRAAGEIYQWLDEGNKIYVDHIRDKPAEMWAKLREIHSKSAPNARFNSLSDLFSIRKRDGESLVDLTTRVDGAMQRVQSLRPPPTLVDGVSTPGYSLEILDEELTIMAMLKALPRDEYRGFVSSILLLNNLTRDAVKEAFRNEENQDKAAEDEAEAIANAARTLVCFLCDGPHRVNECSKLQDARSHVKKDDGKTSNKKRSRRGGGAKADAAKTDSKVEAGCDAPAVKADAAVRKSALPSPTDSDVLWNTDSGATAHMTPRRDWFLPDTYKPWRVPVNLADDSAVYSVGKGSVRIRPRGRDRNGSVLRDVIIPNVLHVPDLANNLLSVVTLAVFHRFSVTFFGRKVFFNIDRELVFTASVNNKLISYVDADTISHAQPASSSAALVSSLSPAQVESSRATKTHAAPVTRSLLHRRLCHLGMDRLDRLVKKDMTEDLRLTPEVTPETHSPCKPCLSGKMHRLPFRKRADHSTEVLDRVFSDVHGPLPIQGHQSTKRYWVSFVDDATRWMEVECVSKKSDVLGIFRAYKSRVETQTGQRVKCLHDDEGGEYISKELKDFCTDEGVRLEFTNTGTPQQNGVAERLNRTISEAVTAMLAEANLPQSFWTFAIRAYRHVHNRCPTSALPGSLTPYEAYKGRKPRVSHLRVFGCAAYVLVSRDKRRGLDSHMVPGVFVGYPDSHVGWEVYLPDRKKTIVSRDVVFDESLFPGLSTKGAPRAPAPDLPLAIADAGPYDFDLTPDDLPALIPGARDAVYSDDEGWEDDLLEEVGAQGDDDDENAPPTDPEAPAPIDNVDALADDGALRHAGSDGTRDPSPARPTSPPPPPPPSLPAVRTRQPRAPPPPREPSLRVRYPARSPNADYYDALDRQSKRASPLEKPVPPPPESTPPILDGEPLWDAFVGSVDDAGEQEVDLVLCHDSDDAMVFAARAYAECGVDFGGVGSVFAQSASAFKVGAHDTNPRSYREAMASEHSAEWYKAMVEEMNSLKANGTWRVVYLPAGKRAIGSRWVFKVKHLPDGAVERFKARVVAQGFSQRPGVDFDETFAPTARWAAVRTVLALAAMDDMHLESVDISSAFLNGVVNAELYLKLPEGFREDVPAGVEKNPGDGEPVGELKKGLYGLKQAGHLWHRRLHEVFLTLGFSRVASDPCVYVYIRDDVRIIIPIHVDDMTIASKSRRAILDLISQLRKHFKLRHLGPTTGLLGVVVARDRPNRRLWIDQRAYAVDVLSRFNMLDASAVTTPMQPGVRLSKADSPSTPEEVEEMKKVPYIQATGALLYLAMCTRPDIAFAVSTLCRFNSCPGPAHWKAVKHLLRYIRGTLDYRIEYSGRHPSALPTYQSYTDADHGGNIDNGRSTTGSLLLVAGGAVSWMHQQSLIFASSDQQSHSM